MTDNSARPWGRMSALFASIVMTLFGVCRDMLPEVILLRASVVGLVCGLTVWSAHWMIQDLAKGSDS